ncbi:MAG: SpoVR family protein, partial [Desulfatiglandales bacterium]
HSGVTSLSRIGLNPYALGMRLFQSIEEMADKGKHSIEFHRLLGIDEREKFDVNTGQGQAYIFDVRENLSDFMFIKTFVDQDFVNRHNLFVVGRRLNQAGTAWEYYVKSRKAEDYRQMLLDSMYHPPHMDIDPKKSENHTLYLVHHFEGKPLVKEFIANTMMGIEYLWGGPVKLETTEVESISPSKGQGSAADSSTSARGGDSEPEVKWQRVLYTMGNRKISKENIE